jgi:predicted DNA-binding transcriptional regulator YafY
LPGLWFNERETLALLTMVQMLSTLEPNGLISDQIEPIKKRLYGILESGCANADELSNRIRVLPIALRPVDQEVFKCIADGLLNRKRLAVMHTSKKSNQKTERVVSPQQLVYYRDNWYLDAFCHEKDDLRTFSVDSIHAATPLESPAVSLTKNALAEAFEETYGIFAGKRAQVAKLRFSPFRARWVSREVWHPAQKAYFEDDGHYILEVPYGDQRELILDILRQGSECEVLAPDSLRTEVINQLIAASKTYHLK